jgi:hypothetical protein
VCYRARRREGYPRTPLLDRLLVAYFVVSTLFLIAPVYTVLGNRVEPRVLGLPWSLVYVLLVVTANLVVLALAYRKHADDDEELR